MINNKTSNSNYNNGNGNNNHKSHDNDHNINQSLPTASIPAFYNTKLQPNQSLQSPTSSSCSSLSTTNNHQHNREIGTRVLTKGFSNKYEDSKNQHHNIKFQLIKQHHKDPNVISLFSKLCKPRITEHEFFDILKTSLDLINDTKTGYFIGDLYYILNKRHFSTFQLCKMLSNSKIKNKLKVMSTDELTILLPNLLETLGSEQNVICLIENTKVLGHITSESMQNILKEFQEQILEALLQFLKSPTKNEHLNRLAINCLGNIFNFSSHKFADKSIVIVNVFHDILINIAQNNKLSDPNTMKILSSLLKALHFIIPEIKNHDSNKMEAIYLELQKYLYIGTTFFQIQPISMFDKIYQNNIENGGSNAPGKFISSSSDYSDFEDVRDKNRIVEIYCKIRNYCCMSIQCIFKNYNKILQNHWTKLLPFNIFTKDFIKFIQNNQEILISAVNNTITTTTTPNINNAGNTSNIANSTSISGYAFKDRNQPYKTRERLINFYKSNYTSPSLLYLLLFDDNIKIKSSICKTIITILDGIQANIMLNNIDGEKLEKIKLDPYKSMSHQLYQIIKNLNCTVMFALYVETNQSVFNQLLRLQVVMISHSSFEKISHIVAEPLILNVLTILMRTIDIPSIHLNIMSCFSAIAGANIKLQAMEKYAIDCKDFNVIQYALNFIQTTLEIKPDLDNKVPIKDENQLTNAIFFECLVLFSKLPKNYIEYIVPYLDHFIKLIPKLMSFADKKAGVMTLKIIEELVSNINHPGRIVDLDNENEMQSDIDVMLNQQQNSQLGLLNNSQSHNQYDSKKLPCSPIKNQLQTKDAFFIFLESMLIDKLTIETNNDLVPHILNILFYLEESDWIAYFPRLKKILLKSMLEFNALVSTKQNFLRLFGNLTSMQLFIKEEAFVSNLIEIILLNSAEKNNALIIKNSWILANMCASLRDYSLIKIDHLQELFNLICIYCNNPKEKIKSNGYRANGYFIKNINDDITKTIFSIDEKYYQQDDVSITTNNKNIKSNGNNDNANNTANKSKIDIMMIRNIYDKDFSACSVKVCWNVCVSLSNILKSNKKIVLKILFDEKLIMTFVHILEVKNNFKTQIHCLEMLHLAVEKVMLIEVYKEIPKILINKYLSTMEGLYDFMEARYLPNLKSSLLNLLLLLLIKLDGCGEFSAHLAIINEFPQKFLNMLYSFVYTLLKDLQTEITSELEKMSSTELQLRLQNTSQGIKNFDDLEVKGAPQQKKLIIDSNKLSLEENLSIKSKLLNIIKVCSRLVNIIDTNDDLQVAFSVYDNIKQLSEISIKPDVNHEILLYDLIY